jgi:ribosome modulation factor
MENALWMFVLFAVIIVGGLWLCFHLKIRNDREHCRHSGQRAFRAGLPIEANPFSYFEAKLLWLEGWKEAATSAPMKSLLVALCLFLVTSPASAWPPEVGTIEDGYKWNGSYWIWPDGGLYTRTWIPAYSYCSYGRNYTVPGYYQYKQYVAVKPAYVAPALPSYTDPGWRGKLLDLAAARDQFEGQIRKSQFEHQQYIESVAALGLSGNFRINGYGAVAPYSYGKYGAAYSYGAAYAPQQQQTYSYASIADVYGDNNINVLYQQAARLVDGSQNLTGQAQAGFLTLVGQSASARERVAAIIARGQAIERIAAKLEQGQVQVRTFEFRTGPGIADPGPAAPLPAEQGPQPRVDALGTLQTYMATNCAACHDGKNAKRWDLQQYPSFTRAQKTEVFNRLATKDESQRMPRTSDGKAGPLAPLDILDVIAEDIKQTAKP